IAWERRAHSFTTVFQQSMPKHDIKGWCGSAIETKTWEGYDLPRIEGSGYLRPQYAPALGRLAAEIRTCAPNLIVPLGGVALWALTGDAGIDTYRGAVGVTSRLVPGIKILPTYHPQHVQQQYKLLTVLIGDLLKVQREALFKEVRLEPREI